MQKQSRKTGIFAVLRLYWPTLLVSLAVVFAGVYAGSLQHKIQMQEERDFVRGQLEMLGANLEGRLNAPIDAARGLVAVLSAEPDMKEERFEWLAERTLANFPEVRNVAGARDLVVHLVYPVEGNESVIGLDYHENPAQRAAAHRVRDTGEFILAGPVDLVQGGTAFIGRFPVFTETRGARDFWGILSVVIDQPQLFQNVGLLHPDLGLDISIVGRDGGGASSGLFWGDVGLQKDTPVTTDVLFLNGSWRLYARPVEGWGSTISQAQFRVVVTCLALLAIGLTVLANHLAVLRSRTINTLKSKELELEGARDEVEKLALHDHLTGLPNRRFLDRKLACLGEKHCAGLIQVDLDGFKAINDTRGHAFGDHLLIEVARRFEAALPEETFLARSGGDEFVIVCHTIEGDAGDSLTQGRALENTARLLISSLKRPFFKGEQKCYIGLSAGIHQVHPDCPDTPENWLRKADQAMYCAKSEGRNRYAFSDPEMDRGLEDEITADDLMEALNSGQIAPYYQPQFGPEGVNLVGLEALARWHHPTLGTLLPGQFMGLAGRLKLDSDIDLRIFEAAANDIACWDQLGLGVPRVSTNLSLRSLKDPKLIERINAVDADPTRMGFELLESIFLDDGNDQLADNVKALKARGFEVEVDDFGTGHSSATSLLMLRPHCLKIDKSLVQAAPTSKENRRLLATIAEMGHALNIKVCAEGIETSSQYLTAQAVGCTSFQGFLFAEPMSADDPRLTDSMDLRLTGS